MTGDYFQQMGLPIDSGPSRKIAGRFYSAPCERLLVSVDEQLENGAFRTRYFARRINETTYIELQPKPGMNFRGGLLLSRHQASAICIGECGPTHARAYFAVELNLSSDTLCVVPFPSSLPTWKNIWPCEFLGMSDDERTLHVVTGQLSEQRTNGAHRVHYVLSRFSMDSGLLDPIDEYQTPYA